MTLNIITPSHFPSKANNRQHFHVSEGCMQALFEEAQRLTAVDHPRWIIRNVREMFLSDSDDWMKILIFHPFFIRIDEMSSTGDPFSSRSSFVGSFFREYCSRKLPGDEDNIWTFEPISSHPFTSLTVFISISIIKPPYSSTRYICWK